MAATQTKAKWVKLMSPHSAGCRLLGYVPYQPWATMPAGHWRDRAGRRTRGQGTCLWLEFRCNDPNCPARVMVRVNDVLEQAQAAIRAAEPAAKAATNP